MTDRQLAAALKFLKTTRDPNGVVYAILLDALGPVEKARLLSVTRLNVRTLERSLKTLTRTGLVKRLQCGPYAYFYAVL